MSTTYNLQPTTYNLVFFGTPDFAAVILEKLAQSWPVLAVVTAPDKPVGRKRQLTPSAVKIIARKLGIPVLQPASVKKEDFKLQIANLKPDVIVVTAYGQILPKELLDIPKHGALNIHPSLLPKYRGASPIQATILAGDEETGVTIMLMDEKMDHGPIISSQKSKIKSQKSTYEELSKQLAELGAKLLIDTLPKWLAGEIKPTPQNHSEATFTKRVKKEAGLIDWTKPTDYIERMTRAFYPWPGVYSNLTIKQFNNLTKKLKIIKVDILKIEHNKKPGTVFLTKDRRMAVACGQDALILEELQLEGKRKMTAQEFLNGHPDFISSSL